MSTHDAIVVGGGFYGACIATYLAGRRGLGDVLLVEREGSLLSRASYNNQARVHNGYHYPRSLTTAYRSRVNLPTFLADWPDAVRQDFTKLYAVARRGSRVSARQFERFCTNIGATYEVASPALTGLFERRLVESVYEVQEWAFDASVLATWATESLAEHDVEVRLGATATGVRRDGPSIAVDLDGPLGSTVSAPLVFNCTYSGLNQLRGDFPGVSTGLKHEITELALVDVPEPLRSVGVTVMDGPYFSLMPFPARGLHTLSHVRYTPHRSWVDRGGLDPYRELDEHARSTRVEWMRRDAARYLPAVADARHVDSAFEVKTVLLKNEGDDGRPILVERSAELPGLYSILGGKIDNIYDVLQRLDADLLDGTA